jgi:hypothetical protein
MKFALLFAALLLAWPVAAQVDATVESSPTAGPARRAEERRLKAERRAQEALEGKMVVLYGGFLVELKRAEKKTQFLSLRQPRDPKNDYKHVHFDERTGRPKGFVFFSVRF